MTAWPATDAGNCMELGLFCLCMCRSGIANEIMGHTAKHDIYDMIALAISPDIQDSSNNENVPLVIKSAGVSKQSNTGHQSPVFTCLHHTSSAVGFSYFRLTISSIRQCSAFPPYFIGALQPFS